MVKPLYIDHCDHTREKDQFLGHVVHKDIIYDAYAWMDYDGINICLRFGNNGSEYVSLGSVGVLREHFKNEKEKEDDYHVKALILYDKEYKK